MIKTAYFNNRQDALNFNKFVWDNICSVGI